MKAIYELTKRFQIDFIEALWYIWFGLGAEYKYIGLLICVVEYNNFVF
jgi:hypothetical protein